MRRLLPWMTVCAFLGVCLPQCATTVDYATGRPTLNAYPIAADVEIGEQLATLMLASSEELGRLTNPAHPTTRAVWKVAARLLEPPSNRARMPPLPWEVNVLAASGANAWCFPGGQVVVLSGLLDSGQVRNEDELATILGHELAHAAARHLTEKRTRDKLKSWMAPFGSFFGPRLVALANPAAPRELVAQIAGQTSDYDQSQELEADIIGLELMARAGYDPALAPAVWRRWKDDPKSEPLTHPANDRRVRELERHAEAARWVAQRAGAITAPSPAAAWRWVDGPSPATTATVTLGDRGSLPEGPRVAQRTVRAPRSLLSITASLHSGPEGEAPRAEVRLVAGRDLTQDHLPFSAVLLIESLESRALVYARQLALFAPLEGAEVRMRPALPRLPMGRYLLRVMAAVGALTARQAKRFDVGAPRTAEGAAPATLSP